VHRRTWVLLCAFVLVTTMLSGLAAGGAAAVPGSPHRSIGAIKVGTTRALDKLAARSTSNVRAAAPSADLLERLAPDLEGAIEGDEGEQPETEAVPVADSDATVTSDTSNVLRSWEGIRAFDGAWNNNGNTFFLEPPDQGLCVGGSFVLETVNGVLQIYTLQGHPLLKGDAGIPTDRSVGLSLNEFYGYPPAFDLATGTYGAFITDPSCYYDPALKRWFHVVLTLDLDPVTGAFLGTNHLDIAVSRGSSPTGRWDVYSVPVQNNGTQGTPDHGCEGGFCIGDYPHIGADAYGFYITTNEYHFFGSGDGDGAEYNGVQLYAFSKAGLATGQATTATYFENLAVPEVGADAFTLRPAWARPSSWDLSNGGTEWFVSGVVGDGFETGITSDDRMVVWGLTGTSTLGGASSSAALDNEVVQTLEYAKPERSLQKPGPTPLLDCINLGVSCFFGADLGHQDGPYPLDSGDGRVMSSFLADGVLWTTVDTALEGEGSADYDTTNGSFVPIDQRAGVVYAAFAPTVSNGDVQASVLQDGYVAVDGNNVTYPSLAVNEENQGYIGVTLVGPDHYPTPAYIPVGLGTNADSVHVVVPGSSPSDGFSGTIFGDFRPRWGDYGYMMPGAGTSLWFAAEYISSTCAFDDWVASFGNCDSTRTLFNNWTTRVTQLSS
jgi:hypothetical protein